MQASAEHAEELLFECWLVLSNPNADRWLVARATELADEARAWRDYLKGRDDR